MTNLIKKPKILFYDIETLPLQAYVWGCGEQYIRHNQLLPNKNMWGIICITYCWNDGSPVQLLKWQPSTGEKGLLEEFDKLLDKADHTIGKNSDRFDTKMLNAHRMLAGLPGRPEWTKYADDLEKQMRRYFRLPSQSLDYISAQLGLGGKVKMELADWIAIDKYYDVLKLSEAKLPEASLEKYSVVQYKKSLSLVRVEGTKALNKMCFYGKKDTRDTRYLWNYLEKHFEPKFNRGVFDETNMACKHCGSTDLRPNGTRISGKTKWSQFTCNNCLSYAGRAPYNKKTILG